MQTLLDRFTQLENTIHGQLVRHSVSALRIALGLVFLGFGVLKFFPDVSPAQDLTEVTSGILFLHLIPAQVGLVAIAALECTIGVLLLAGKWMRLAVWMLAAEFVGILSPIVLLPGRLFSGPYNAPTLEGQYVLKDIILVTAALVVAAATFRGGRLVRDEPQPVASGSSLAARRKLDVVLLGSRDPATVPAVCVDHGISEGDFYRWRDQVLDGAVRSLDDHRDGLVPALPPKRQDEDLVTEGSRSTDGRFPHAGLDSTSPLGSTDQHASLASGSIERHE